jgi:choline-sulfatase
VPLIVHAPKQFDAHRVSASVSHLDLLPTLVELARGKPRDAWPDSLDGRSLVPHLLNARDAHDEAIGEYLGEGAIAPIVMLRRGRFKFIHTPADPDQLYDVEADPLERNNLASNADYKAEAAAFRDEIASRWNLAALHDAVLQSQRRRRFHFDATTRGVIQSWDWQPHVDASQRYMRNHIDLDTLEAMARFPPVAHP